MVLLHKPIIKHHLFFDSLFNPTLEQPEACQSVFSPFHKAHPDNNKKLLQSDRLYKIIRSDREFTVPIPMACLSLRAIVKYENKSSSMIKGSMPVCLIDNQLKLEDCCARKVSTTIKISWVKNGF